MNNLNENIVRILNDEGISNINPYIISSKYLIDTFENIKTTENQQKIVVLIGNSKDLRFFEFLEFCIFYAKNENIRHGSLKYVYKFKNQVDLKPIFERIEKNNQREEYEPYFSMAKNMSFKNVT